MSCMKLATRGTEPTKTYEVWTGHFNMTILYGEDLLSSC